MSAVKYYIVYLSTKVWKLESPKGCFTNVSKKLSATINEGSIYQNSHNTQGTYDLPLT